MKAALSSAEYMKRVLERRYAMTKAHNQVSRGACMIMHTGFMVGSVSYARQHTGSRRIARKLRRHNSRLKCSSILVLVEGSRLGKA